MNYYPYKKVLRGYQKYFAVLSILFGTFAMWFNIGYSLDKMVFLVFSLLCASIYIVLIDFIKYVHGI
jgi:hypothetical protein